MRQITVDFRTEKYEKNLHCISSVWLTLSCENKASCEQLQVAVFMLSSLCSCLVVKLDITVYVLVFLLKIVYLYSTPVILLNVHDIFPSGLDPTDTH